jgi:serine/threonine-protein kinase HipA
MSVNSKRDHFNRDELIATGQSISISRPEEIIDEVTAAVNSWMEFADEAGITKAVSREIKKQQRKL